MFKLDYKLSEIALTDYKQNDNHLKNKQREKFNFYSLIKICNYKQTIFTSILFFYQKFYFSIFDLNCFNGKLFFHFNSKLYYHRNIHKKCPQKVTDNPIIIKICLLLNLSVRFLQTRNLDP